MDDEAASANTVTGADTATTVTCEVIAPAALVEAASGVSNVVMAVAVIVARGVILASTITLPEVMMS